MLLLALLLLAPPAAEELCARHVQAIGGPEAAAKVRSLVRKGTFEMAAGETGFPAQTYSKSSGQWRFVLTIPGVYTIEQAGDGQTAWTQTPGGTETMPAAQVKQLEPALDLSLLMRPASRLAGMTVKSQETFRGRDVWVGEHAGVPVYFDAETGFLTRVGVVLFEEYRKVDGVTVPHVVRFADRKTEQVFRAAEIELNAEVEDSRFEREANTLAYRTELRKTVEESLNRYLKGIDAGAAREVLENLQNFPPEDGRILYDLIVARGYKRGIEIGTARGNSAIWMGLAFQRNGGKLITIEKDAKLSRIAGENMKRAGLGAVVECRVNDAFQEIPRLEGNFDFVFMDTGTALHKKFMDLLYDRVTAGGAIASHNSNSFQSLMPDFLQAITTDPNLDTKITTTPGGGVSVSIKRK